MGSSPSGGIQPIFSEEYVEREKRETDTNTLICLFPFIATFVFLLNLSLNNVAQDIMELYAKY